MHRLDAPLRLRAGVTLPNRVALAPLTNTQSAPDGVLGEDELRWLVRRAAGGFGYVSTCAAFVSEEGHAWEGQLGVAADAHLAGLTELATAVRAAGGVPVIQLHHGGRQAKVARRRLGPADEEGVRGARDEDLARVIRDFVAAARRAQQAGFAGVEIHGANGYLFTQFLAPADNPREDAWGGDLEGRARLLRLTVQAVRSALSPRMAVGVRLSPVDTWMRRGLVLEDGVQVARWMAEDGVDWVHLSLADAAGPPPHERGGPLVARAVRDALPAEVALLAAGGVWTREDAARALDAGADVAVLGKAAIIHPDWARASAGAGWSPTRPPWSAAQLAAVDVGPAFVRYLRGFRDLVAE